MYKIVETDKSAKNEYGTELHPILTLADEYGGRVQIGIDDHCYVCHLKHKDGDKIFYRYMTHLFRELHAALCTLPLPV